jgi:hypothetical protein
MKDENLEERGFDALVSAGKVYIFYNAIKRVHDDTYSLSPIKIEFIYRTCHTNQ